MNSISVTGHLGTDAEQRFLPTGGGIVNARIAVNGFKKEDPPMWIGVTIFGQRGESVLPYLKKGKRIGVVGRLQVREYERRDGNGKGTSVEIVASDVVLLDGGERREGGAQRAPAQRQGSQRDASFDDDFPPDDFGSGGSGGAGGGGDDDQIPFMPWTLP